MLNDLELMIMQTRALFTHDAGGSRLLFINEPDNLEMPAPRLFLGRTRDGNIWRFRPDLPDNLCRELDELCKDEPPLISSDDERLSSSNNQPLHYEKYINLLEQHGSEGEIEGGPAYWFSERESLLEVVSDLSVVTVTDKNSDVLLGGFEKLMEELPRWQPFVALIEQNKAVSVCRSVRITHEAHEAGVETLPEFRGKGYAKEVVLEWARQVQAIGAIPLYSTSWENHASQGVARKLNLRFYGTDFSIV